LEEKEKEREYWAAAVAAEYHQQEWRVKNVLDGDGKIT